MLKIRPYKNSDAKHILSWIDNQTLFYQWCADVYGKYPICENDMNAFYNSAKNKENIKITVTDGNNIVGHFTIRFTDNQKSIARLGFVIVNNKMRGHGLGKNIVKLALKYSFDTLKAKKVKLAVFKNNTVAYNCYKSVGFKETTSANPKSYIILGEKWDCHEMEYLKNETVG